jgi:hypothetical protein
MTFHNPKYTIALFIGLLGLAASLVYEVVRWIVG